MKKYILPFMSIVMLMAMVGCSSSDDAVAENKAVSKLVPMTFTATQESNAGTRSALNGSNAVYWQTNDKISVFDGTGAENNQEFTLTGNVADGKFSGEASSDATKFTAVYPYTSGAQLASDGSVSGITLPAEQTATADSFDPAAALMMAYTEDKSQLNFKNAVSLVKVTTQFACKKIVLSANEDIAGTGTLTMTFDNDTYTSSFTFSSGNSKTITLKPAIGESFGAGTYYIVVPPITLTNGFTITFTAEDNTEYTRKSTKSNTFNRSRIKDFGSFATTGDYWYDASRGDKVRADQEVDMGLTVTISGVNYKVIFAKTNLTKDGLAENEYDYGDYFAWGATEPWYSSISGNTFTWEDGYSDGYTQANAPLYDGLSYTKYTKQYEVLEADDDAARQILGGDWQIPIKEIWRALYDTSKYAWSWTIKGGYNGYQVTSTTDDTKTLFLPAAGGVEGTSFDNYVGKHGDYWSGTAWLNPATAALMLDFHDRDVTPGSSSARYCGHSVRPVRLVEVPQSLQ